MGPRCNISCVWKATLLHCMHLENFTVEPYAFLCETQHKRIEKCCMQHQKNKNKYFEVLDRRGATQWNVFVKQNFLAYHITCLKPSILERMFDFKNVHNFISKITWRREKWLTRKNKQNPILWGNTDPNYRNKIKRSLIKVKLVALFELSLKRFLSSHLHSGGIKSTFWESTL